MSSWWFSRRCAAFLKSALLLALGSGLPFELPTKWQHSLSLPLAEFLAFSVSVAESIPSEMLWGLAWI